jgi:UDP-N-acetylmuramoyl-L-alanyl-D-glutamate--2,6-diaminopimelate ligase
MKLSQLLTDCKIHTSSGDLDTEILGLAYDSRDVARGSLFIAIRGTRMDGNRYVPQAIAKGAVAVVSAAPRIESLAMPWIQVDERSGSSTRVAR